jgi:undecaprenol kinase
MKPPKYKLSDSFRFAFEGIKTTFNTERNFRIHLVAAILVIVWAWILKIPTWDFALLLIVISLVLCAELLNTAIEAVIDLVSPEWHPLAKVAKDTAAGAVLVSAVFAVAVGLVILYKPMMIWLGLN